MRTLLSRPCGPNRGARLSVAGLLTPRCRFLLAAQPLRPASRCYGLQLGGAGEGGKGADDAASAATADPEGPTADQERVERKKRRRPGLRQLALGRPRGFTLVLKTPNGWRMVGHNLLVGFSPRSNPSQLFLMC